MWNQCNDFNREHGAAVYGRREFLTAGAALITAPLLTGAATGVRVAQADAPAGTGPFSVRAYGAASASSPLAPMQIKRRAVGPNDVLLDVLYCGICHSDIHTARNEWASSLPTQYPSVPGHEIIGRVQAVGSAVTKFKIGDIAAWGAWSIPVAPASTAWPIASRTASMVPRSPTARPILCREVIRSAAIPTRWSSPSAS